MYKIIIEVFRAKIEGNSILYTKHDVVVGEDDKRDPDELVHEELIKHMHVENINKAITHSTSWRFQKDGSIVLTYLVYSDFDDLSSKYDQDHKIHALKIEDMEIARSKSHRSPRPEKIEEKNVVSHAIRHLAFLIQVGDKDRYSKLLGRNVSKLTQIFPQVSGRIRSDFFPI